MRCLALLAMLVGVSCAAHSQNAFIQVLHNCADPSGQLVDVWINESAQVDDLAFRFASDAREVPAGNLKLGIAPATSTASSESFATYQFQVEAGKRYALVIQGVMNTDNFLPNPGGLDINLRCLELPNVPPQAPSGSVNVSVVHGVTDAPAIDISGLASMQINNLSFGSTTSFSVVPAQEFVITVSPTGGQPLIAYKTDLAKYDAKSMILIASGFLVPLANQNGKPFGFFGVSNEGGPFDMMPVTGVPTAAKVQVIHNAADPALASVDVYVSGIKVQSDFAFRTSSTFIDVPAGTAIPIAIASSQSTGPGDAFSSTEVNLQTGRYVMVLNGVRDTSAFAPNPTIGGASIAFQLFPINNVHPSSASPGQVDIIYFHGCTDAPAVDVYHDAEKDVEQLAYGASSAYVTLDAGETTIKLSPAGCVPIISVPVNLASLSGQAVVILASGFLVPAANQNGSPLGLRVARSGGGPLIELGSVTSVPGHSAARTANQVFPNPASTDASILLATCSEAELSVFSSSGELVQRIVSEGAFGVAHLNTSGLAQGMYVVRVQQGAQSAMHRLMVVR